MIGDRTTARFPRRVVALGGGTGMPAVLRGLRDHVANGDTRALTAVVTMTDDGGSSGRLRRSMGVPPPGDVRNCLVALSREEELLAGLFQHRYEACRELGGHTVGNLILAALVERSGSFLKAVEMSSHVLRTVGRILPATLDDVALEAELQDGSRLTGETAIASCTNKIRRISIRPATASPSPGVLEAILDADLVVLGPGSLYTSLVPNLVVKGIGQAMRDTRAPVILLANLVGERGEAGGLDLRDHVSVIEQHAGKGVVDAILVHRGPIPHDVLARYLTDGAAPLAWPESGLNGVRAFPKFLLAPGPMLRHEPRATAEGLIEAWAELTAPAVDERTA